MIDAGIQTSAPVSPELPKQESAGLTEKDKIQVLLQEYNTLRSEIVTRTGIGFQLIGISIAAIGVLLHAPVRDNLRFGITILAVIVLGIAVYRIFMAGTRLAARLRSLEMEINRRTGEELLKWETHFARMAFYRWRSRWNLP